MKLHYHYFMGVFALALGCGGSSGGLSDSEKLTAVTSSQAVQLCNELVADEPQKTVTCDGAQITVGETAADCATAGSGTNTTPASCTATVGDLLDCLNQEYSDPCGSDGSADAAACASLANCGSGS
jgi:hypothetical protein